MAELQGTPVAQDALAVAQLELEGNPNALALRRPFDPVAHDLDASFRLTRFADLKGWGCKVPQEVLGKLLEGLQADDASAQDHEHAHFMHMAIPRIGKSMSEREWIDERAEPLVATRLRADIFHHRVFFSSLFLCLSFAFVFLEPNFCRIQENYTREELILLGFPETMSSDFARMTPKISSARRKATRLEILFFDFLVLMRGLKAPQGSPAVIWRLCRLPPNFCRSTGSADVLNLDL